MADNDLNPLQDKLFEGMQIEDAVTHHEETRQMPPPPRRFADPAYSENIPPILNLRSTQYLTPSYRVSEGCELKNKTAQLFKVQPVSYLPYLQSVLQHALP